MIDSRKLRNTIGTQIERQIALYPGNNKKLDCYLAHIIGVNSPISIPGYTLDKDHLYPLGTKADWNNPGKIYEVNYPLTKDDIEVLKIQMLRFLDPLNYFVTPQTRDCTVTIPNFHDNIGEYQPVVEYVSRQYEGIYGKAFTDFLFKAHGSHAQANNGPIGLHYQKGLNAGKKNPAETVNKTANTVIGVTKTTPHSSDGLDGFRDYLGKSGKQTSTIASYCSAIRGIMKEENISYDELVKHSSDLASEYSMSGSKATLGNKSKGTWRNAIARFDDYVKHK